jgi:undecaprenyl-diphosphatase
MNITQAVISGAVQGLTEFLPVSSSGHLVLLHKIFGLREPQLAFDITLHMATMASVLVFFAKDIAAIIKKDRKTARLILLACVPTFAIGFLFKDSAEKMFNSSVTVGYMLMITGVWLVFAHSMSVRRKNPREISTIDSFLIGIAQGIAVIPGISRSGATIGAGLALGVDGRKAVRFSFLLSVPAILGASAVKFVSIKEGFAASGAPSFASGAAAAFLTGIAAIYLLLKAVETEKLWAFGAYCMLAGAAAILISG